MKSVDVAAVGRISSSPSQFSRFLMVGLAAAILNFGSRFLFNAFFPYAASVALAFCIGLCSAFALNRLFVFSNSTNSLGVQATYFVLINLLGLAQTMVISLLLAHWILPLLGIRSYAETVAHAIGILVPIVTSFLGHKYFSFKVE